MELVIASSNVHKIRECRSILKQLRFLDLLSLLDFPNYQPPEETGKTFEENARLKALHAAQALDKWVIADDSGLVVPALKGEPGVRSARFAGEGATDKDNRKKLLEMMRPLTESERTAYFECWIVLASPQGVVRAVSGLCEGSIITEEKGNHGFGYDPLFLKYEYSKTFAEIDEETKNRISHRRKALDKILPTLESISFATAT
ncbi:MAG: RdgB/HAM1 family non-canonical purine NTP pyrophosphatase [Chlamydiales bacterium]|nr:RdgB/HAM1 family non-canonical purine NTP pyrophosphatase [Chlamydiales bacterium]